jgi:hypothetical protein
VQSTPITTKVVSSNPIQNQTFWNLFSFCWTYVQHPGIFCWTLKLLEYCYCNLNKKFENYVLNLVNFSKFESIPSWIWLLFFDAWFQRFESLDSLWDGIGRFTFARLSSVVMLQERPHFYDRHITVNKILNRNGFGEGNDTNQGSRVFFILLI